MTSQSQTSEKRGRSVVEQQKELLVQFMSQNKQLVCAKISATFSNKDAQNKWQEIAEELNAVENGSTKSWLKWRNSILQTEVESISFLSRDEIVDRGAKRQSNTSQDSNETFHRGLDHIVKNCISCDLKSSPTPSKRKLPEQEAATSTTPAEPSSLSESSLVHLNKIPTQEWGIEEVIQFIDLTDPCLGVHAELFRKHEIDGKAFLLLNFDMMMKYMGLKLGPALKICNIVARLKGRRHNSL